MEERGQFQLAAVAAWVLGEYGDVVVSRANRLDGEAGLVLSERDVVALLESILCEFNTPGAVKQVAVTALMKLSARFPAQAAPIRLLVAKGSTSIQLVGCRMPFSARHVMG